MIINFCATTSMFLSPTSNTDHPYTIWSTNLSLTAPPSTSIIYLSNPTPNHLQSTIFNYPFHLHHPQPLISTFPAPPPTSFICTFPAPPPTSLISTYPAPPPTSEGGTSQPLISLISPFSAPPPTTFPAPPSLLL